ncbi:hypothetical protein NVP1291O_11 [Vibrio phage 1.291.O._10N.286.55.F6]|nr:hypothetical protein NVP1291O_11 [Vibrio phage 1.291.O._10N.286.55.F6]
MSWHCSQGEVEAFSLQNYLDGIPSAQLSMTKSTETAYYKGSQTGLSIDSQSGMMFQHSMENHGEVKSTSLAEDSHVKTLAQQEKGWELQEKGLDFGKSTQELLAKFDQKLSLLKTPQILELEGSMSFSKTCMRWGMMQDGVCLALGTSVSSIKGIACGLLPSPSGVNGGRNHIAGRLDEWGGSSNPFRKTEIASLHLPRFEEWMMGWPETWAAQTGFEMDKYQSWLQMHSEF